MIGVLDNAKTVYRIVKSVQTPIHVQSASLIFYSFPIKLVSHVQKISSMTTNIGPVKIALIIVKIVRVWTSVLSAENHLSLIMEDVLLVHKVLSLTRSIRNAQKARKTSNSTTQVLLRHSYKMNRRASRLFVNLIMYLKMGNAKNHYPLSLPNRSC